MNPLPTPTPYATPTAEEILITIDASDWSIWNFTDEAINAWNHHPPLGQVFQVAIIIILVVTFVVIMRQLLQKTMSER